MTYLKIRWERDNEHHEEVWERENDGILWAIFIQLIGLMHNIAKIEKE